MPLMQRRAGRGGGREERNQRHRPAMSEHRSSARSGAPSRRRSGIGSASQTSDVSPQGTISDANGSPSIARTSVSRGESSAIVDIIPETLMALDWREGSTMGCACFDTESGALRMYMDIPEAGVEVAEQLLAQVQPTTVLVSGRLSEELLSFLEKRATAEEGVVEIRSDFVLRLLPTSTFSFQAAQDRLVALQSTASFGQVTVMASAAEDETGMSSIPSRRGAQPNNSGAGLELRNMCLIRCGVSIDLESQISVSCAGALLDEINKRRSANNIPESDVVHRAFEIISLEMLSLAHSMYITQDAMKSLQIMQSEHHPNCQISGGVQSEHGDKESLSVYGLFYHLAGTPQGRASLKRLFFRPTTDRQVIAERQAFIQLLLRPENSEHLGQISKTMRRIGNAKRHVLQLKKGAESPLSARFERRGACAMLKTFVTQLLKLRELVIGLKDYGTIEILSEVGDNARQKSLILVGEMIERTIIFDDSGDGKRSCIRPGVSADLDRLKRRYDGLSSFLTEVVLHVRAQLPEWAGQYVHACIFLPQLGFLTVVDADPTTGSSKYEGQGLQGSDWQKMFVSDDKVCFKNHFMTELDKQYGDMYCEIGDKEVEIIHALGESILEHEEVLIDTSELCGHLDALLALALGAQKYQWCKPQVIDTECLLIKEGRHPLQELVVPSFIANDCHMANALSHYRSQAEVGTNRVLILTGPNHSGKSVYMKQVAIIVYLAHIGSYVPAEQATIGITDRILTRISTRESVSRVESAFAIDLKQIAQAMRRSTSRSLVLVDEFGKGTNSDDGAGLLTAFIQHFLTQGDTSPKLLLATHFHEIFEGHYIKNFPQLEIAHLQIQIDENVLSENQQRLTYLFKLAHGHSKSSLGGMCAALNGVPGAVVSRAEAISTLVARHEDLTIACAKLSESEQVSLRWAEVVARRFVETDLTNLGHEGTNSQAQVHSVLEEILKRV